MVALTEGAEAETAVISEGPLSYILCFLNFNPLLIYKRAECPMDTEFTQTPLMNSSNVFESPNHKNLNI